MTVVWSGTEFSGYLIKPIVEVALLSKDIERRFAIALFRLFHWGGPYKILEWTWTSL